MGKERSTDSAEIAVLHDEQGTLPPRAVRYRSDGPLTADELAKHRAARTPLAFDPLQSGWLTTCTIDDLADHGPDTRAASQSPTLSLRPWDEATDLEEFRALLDDPALWAFMPEPYPGPLSKDHAADLIYLSNTGTHHIVRAIISDGVPVGQVRVLLDSDPAHPGLAEISYWVGRRAWGQGIARHSVPQFADWCLQEIPELTGLVARIQSANKASKRVIARAGFTFQGIDPKDGIWNIYRRMRA